MCGEGRERKIEWRESQSEREKEKDVCVRDRNGVYGGTKENLMGEKRKVCEKGKCERKKVNRAERREL